MLDSRLEVMLLWQGVTGSRLSDGVLKEVGYAPPRVVLPSGIVELAHACFSGQADLEWIALPSSLISVGEYAFSNCPKLGIIRILPGQEVFKDNLLYGNNAVLDIRRGNLCI